MSLADLIPGLSSSQRANARIIEQEMSAAGLPKEIAAAAIVNAYAESGLNAAAQSRPPEDSAGLFQLNAKGAGSGMSTAERQDPVKNTRRIIEVAKGRSGKPMMDAYAAGERDVAHLAAKWSTYVERPADKLGQEAKRAVLALRLFPAGIGAAGRAVGRVDQRIEAVPRWIIVAGVVTLGGSVAALLTWGARRRSSPPSSPGVAA